MASRLLVRGFCAICFFTIGLNSTLAQTEVLRRGFTHTSVTAEERAIHQRLQQPISVAFKGIPFEDVVEAIALKARVPMRIDRRAFAVAGIRLDMLVTENLAGDCLGVVLDRLFRPRGLRFVVADQVLLVTTAYSERLVQKTYSIGRFISPEEEVDPKSIQEFVQDAISPEFWEAKGGNASMRYIPKDQTLVICHTEEYHDEISQLFAALRKLGDLKVNVRIGVVLASVNTAVKWKQSLERDALPVKSYSFNPISEPESVGPFGPTGNQVNRNLDRLIDSGDDKLLRSEFGLVSYRQLSQLLASTNDDNASQILQSPFLDIHNGERYPLESVQKVRTTVELNASRPRMAGSYPYYTIPKQKGSAPEVLACKELIASGWKCEVTPVVSPDRKSLRTSVNFTHIVNDSKGAVANRITAARVFETPSGASLIWSLGEVQGTDLTRRQYLFLVVTPVIVDRSQEP